MTERVARRRTGVSPEERAPRLPQPPPPSRVSSVLALQRSAGNAAVTRLIQREAMEQCLVDDTAETVTQRWANKHRIKLNEQGLAGDMSQPEAVDQLRRANPLAKTVSPADLWGMLAKYGVKLPPHRLKATSGGVADELAAVMSNLGGDAKVHTAAGELKLSVEGLFAETKIGGAKLSAGAGPEGVEGSVEGGGVEGKLKTDYEGKKIEASVRASKAELEGELERDEHGWSKWKLTFKLHVAGPKATPVDQLHGAVAKAYKGIEAISKHVGSGGHPSDPYVKETMDAVQKTMEELSKLAEAKEKEAGVTLEAWGGSTETDVPGGPPVKGVAGGAGVTIRF